MVFTLNLVLSFAAAIVDSFVNPKQEVIISYAIAIPIVLSLPRALRKLFSSVRLRVTEEWVRQCDRWSFALLALNIPGSVILHDMGIQYDRFLHFAAPIAGFNLFILAVAALRPLDGKAAVAKRALAAMIVSLFLWEAYQATADAVFGTDFFHDTAQLIQVDATEDILFGLCGTVVAYVLFLALPRAWRYAERVRPTLQ